MNKPNIDVVLSPIMLPIFDIEDHIVVVIDILRATSTICTALHYGAKGVIPVATIPACLEHKGEGYILAAERKGSVVDGFEFGNSPFEYMDGVIKDKTLVLTTTNGTRAIQESMAATHVVVGAFLNLDILCDWLIEQKKKVLLLCAGWKDNINMEDTLFAGAVLNKLKDGFTMESDGALFTEHYYSSNQHDLLNTMKKASHSLRLNKLGVSRDIQYCFQHNQAPVVPILEDGVLVNVL